MIFHFHKKVDIIFSIYHFNDEIVISSIARIKQILYAICPIQKSLDPNLFSLLLKTKSKNIPRLLSRQDETRRDETRRFESNKEVCGEFSNPFLESRGNLLAL